MLRRPKMQVLMSLVALPLAACDSSLEAPSLGVSQGALVQIQGSSCVPLLAGQTLPAGTVCTSIDGENLKVTYSTTGGWSLYETHLWAGLNLSAMPQTNSGNPKLGNFPYNSGALGGVSSYSVLVPLSVFGLSGNMTSCAPVSAFLVAHAVVKRPLPDGSFQSETAYGDGTRLVQKGNWATWFSITLGCVADEPPPLATCETAFAFGDDLSTCFIDSGLVSTNRWGWFTGPLAPGEYTFDLYAGAGQCDLGNGTFVGTLSVSYSGGVATISFVTLAGFTMDETHLYVGSEPLPRKNGEYTVAPGQYGHLHELSGASSDSFTVSGLDGGIYVVAHAVVCSSSW